ASAQVGHVLIDVRVGGLRHTLEQRRCRHDLSGLAIAALGHIYVEPGSLDLLTDRMVLHGLNRGDRPRSHARYGNRARPLHTAVDVHAARTAQRRTAAELRPLEVEHIAQHPEKWRAWIGIYRTRFTIDIERVGHGGCLALQDNVYIVRLWGPRSKAAG